MPNTKALGIVSHKKIEMFSYKQSDPEDVANYVSRGLVYITLS
jgi:hypothetical protein